MRKGLKLFSVLSFVVFMITPMGVAASGYESTSGYIDTSEDVTLFYYPRTVDNPSTPGPEVAFYKTGGPATIWLGTWQCGYPPYQGAGGLYPVVNNNWSGILFTSTAGATFCTFGRSESGSGTFYGQISWD